MLLPQNPYVLPQHYNRHICGPSCSCKHQFLWISPTLSIRFVWIIWVQYATDNLSGQVKSVCFIGHFWYFNPQWNPEQATDKPSGVGNLLVSWDKKCSYHVLTYKLWFVEGVHSGSTMKPWSWGSCSLPCHCNITDRSEQDSSKLRHTVCNVFIICSAI
jgi:hypothetical protein